MSEAYIFPLSFTQQRLWFLDQMSPKSPSYNITTGIEMNFPIQESIANRSLRALIQRHEILRTRFVTKKGKPYQLVVSQLDLDIRFVDLSQQAYDQLNDTVQVMVNQEMRNGFDLEKGPLLRGKILRLAEARHLFLLSMHHIISDGWSIGLFFQEFRQLYEAFTRGRPNPLPDLPIQYADYSVWQRNWLKGDVLHQHLDYWQGQLARVPELQLPTDFQRPPVQLHRGSYLQKVLPDSLIQGIETLARREGATLFMGLLSAFYVLLHFHTRQDDLVIGTPIAGRNRAELEGLLGFFVNNLVFRADLSGNPDFKTILQRVRRMTLDAYAHQDLPFERLVEALKLERDLSRNPIFQVTFQLINTPTLQSTPHQADQTRSLGTEAAQSIQKGTAMFALAVALIQTGEGMMVQMEYSTDIFRGDTIQRMIDHYETLLASIIAQPTAPLSELRYFEADAFPLPPAVAPSPADAQLAHRVFERTAQRYPDRIALHAGKRRITFAQLNQRANQIAHQGIAAGWGPGTLIGLCLPDALDMIIGMLAVLKSGAAYTPLDPSYPPERIRRMGNRADCLVTTRELANDWPPTATQVIHYREDWPAEDPEAPWDDPNVELSADHLAYVLFTSGSTGMPKGVMISHAALMNHMNWMRGAYPLVAEDRVLQRTSFSFDASVWEVYAPLLEGAQLVLTEQERKGDSEYLGQVMATARVTVVQCVPSLLGIFHELGLLINKPHLRRIFCGGEALPASLVNQVLEQYPQIELINLYGPTESTIDATYWPAQALARETAMAPIGRAIEGVGVYLLDRYLNPVPVGVMGEIYLSGHSLARGYFQMPGRTAECFLPDPFAGQPGARMYRTGDLGRWDTDGQLHFRGRTDDQIKLRGYRIELGDITAALQSHPAISNAVVVLVEAELIAYYEVPEELAESQLWTHLQEQLPSYLLPALLVRMAALPLAPNGKIDRKALPLPHSIRQEAAEQLVAPTQPLEIIMAEIWQDILGVERVGLQQHFFRDLGGHSLLATQLISRIRHQLDLEVNLQRIFEHPLLGSFVESLQKEAPNPGQLTETAELLLSINQMSEEEIDRLLMEE